MRAFEHNNRKMCFRRWLVVIEAELCMQLFLLLIYLILIILFHLYLRVRIRWQINLASRFFDLFEYISYIVSSSLAVASIRN